LLKHMILQLHEGEAPEALYVIKSGRVKVLRLSTDGKDVVLRVCARGQMLGTVATFDGGGYPGTAQVIEASLSRSRMAWALAGSSMKVVRACS